MSVSSRGKPRVIRFVRAGVITLCAFLAAVPVLRTQTADSSSFPGSGSLLPPSVAPGDVVLPNGTIATNNGATDPGVPGGGQNPNTPSPPTAPRAGSCIGRNLLTQQQIDYCNNVAKGVFEELDSVFGVTKNGNTNGAGLGPTFNGNQCSGCHVFPAVGGSSPPGTNPQIGMGRSGGATNQPIPFFVFNGGPVREARFITGPNGQPDGGVHDVFSIAFRSDNGGCTAPVPNFVQQAQNHNLIFRIPTPTFGDGLIEAISESTINSQVKSGTLGITGMPNRNGNDGTITRFGWKAQNKSLLLFSGEAYNVEMGVTNEIFPNERDQTPDCQFQPMPEDLTNNLVDQTTPFDPFNPVPLNDSADIENFTIFMRFLAPPLPACNLGLSGLPSSLPACSSDVSAGFKQFQSIGCALCHTPTLSTGQNSAIFTQNGDGQTPAFNLPVNLFSDLLVHHMGVNLSDGITQGAAGPDQFRSAPLWGLGQRAFFLHDGRTSNLISAIHFHGNANDAGSEANAVVEAFDDLNGQQQEQLLEFLRSL